jgi:ABC-2 type transport system ATP-binding protein
MKIKIEGLVKMYKGKTALDGLSLSVNEGDVYGFIGPNGAGKTTTMSIMVGLIRYDSGICEIDGKAAGSSGYPALGYLPEEPAFAEYLTGREYAMMLARTMGLDRPGDAATRLLDNVSLGDAADRRVSGYSRGMRQRLGLACALLGDPDLLILDEPSSALDPEGRKAVADLVLALKSEGKTIFLSTHILSDIERICDRIALIDSGKVMLEGSVKELLDDGLSRIVDIALSRPLSAAERVKLMELPFVENIERGSEASLFSAYFLPGDPDGARIDMMRELSVLSLPVVSLIPRKTSLEELFLAKVVRHE